MMRNIIYFMIITRASGDLVFEYLKNISGGANVTLGAVYNMAALLLFLIHLFTGHTNPRSCSAVIFAPLLFVMLCSSIAVPDHSTAVKSFLQFSTYVAMFAFGSKFSTSRLSLKKSVFAIMLASVPPCFVGFFQLIAGDAYLSDPGRLQGTFSHSNIFAFYLVLILGIIVFIFSSTQIVVSKSLAGTLLLYAVILLILLVMTKTRSAWIGVLIIFGVYGLFVNRKFVYVLMLMIVVAGIVPEIRDRVLDLATGNVNEDFAKLNSYAWRELLWASAIDRIFDAPFLGHGLETFSLKSPEFFPLPIEDGTSGVFAHNVFVQMLFELGLIGFLTYTFIFSAILIALYRRKRIDLNGSLVAGSIVVGYLVESYSDNVLYYLSFNWYFWFFLGLISNNFGVWTRQMNSSIISYDEGTRQQDLAMSRPT